jgi:Nif-specific regulatory protein
MRARLTIEAGDGAPEELDLDPETPATLGRSRDNSIVLRDEHASRMHARLFFDVGRWHVRDFGMNGTLLGGERIQQQAELEHGQELRIGNVRMRFALVEPTAHSTIHRSRSSSSASSASTGTFSTGSMRKEDLTLLTSFMAAGASSTEPTALLRHGLELLLAQTNAYVVGCLSADPADPIEKIVLPDSASIDPTMSRHLTRRALRDNRTFWLGTDITDSRPKDSLREVTDALCVPLRSGGTPRAMLHLYKKGEFFCERDLRLCEALADFLDGCLQAMLRHRVAKAEIARLASHPPIIDVLVGDSPPMVRLRQRIARAAKQPWPVLIQGEAGTCPDLVALSLHRSSSRTSGPLVVVGVDGLAPQLQEAELFGKRVGKSKVQLGHCHQADEGTLYLDEIGALTPDSQARLQNLLTDKSVRPVGATGEYRLDVRVVAATQRDLEKAAARGTFRRKLLVSLSHEVIEIPPLRLHLEDIPFLVQYFLDRLALETRREVTLSLDAVDKLQAYHWPGNLRQLRAELEAAVLRTSGRQVEAGDVLVNCARLMVNAGKHAGSLVEIENQSANSSG